MTRKQKAQKEQAAYDLLVQRAIECGERYHDGPFGKTCINEDGLAIGFGHSAAYQQKYGSPTVVLDALRTVATVRG